MYFRFLFHYGKLLLCAHMLIQSQIFRYFNAHFKRRKKKQKKKIPIFQLIIANCGLGLFTFFFLSYYVFFLFCLLNNHIFFSMPCFRQITTQSNGICYLPFHFCFFSCEFLLLLLIIVHIIGCRVFLFIIFIFFHSLAFSIHSIMNGVCLANGLTMRTGKRSSREENTDEYFICQIPNANGSTRDSKGEKKRERTEKGVKNNRKLWKW